MRIVFIGTGEIGVPTLRALQKSEHELAGVVKQPDKPVGRAQKIAAPPVKKALRGDPLKASPARTLQPARIKDREAIDHHPQGVDRHQDQERDDALVDPAHVVPHRERIE